MKENETLPLLRELVNEEFDFYREFATRENIEGEGFIEVEEYDGPRLFDMYGNHVNRSYIRFVGANESPFVSFKFINRNGNILEAGRKTKFMLEEEELVALGKIHLFLERDITEEEVERRWKKALASLKEVYSHREEYYLRFKEFCWRLAKEEKVKKEIKVEQTSSSPSCLYVGPSFQVNQDHIRLVYRQNPGIMLASYPSWQGDFFITLFTLEKMMTKKESLLDQIQEYYNLYVK